jgi:CubicO group peptidase (beta-lactamase class C family)
MSQATLANWRTAPFTHWAFRNIPALIPTDRIEADPAGRRALPIAPRSFDGFALQLGPDKRFDLPGFLQATSSDAFIVMVDGKIAHESYGHGLTAETPHILMSMSKAVTGLVAGMLQAAGKLDVDAPVSALLPEIAATSYRGATIRHLLDMRAGAVFDPPTLAAYDAATHWDPRAEGTAPADFHAFFAGMPDVAGTHGGPFKYDTANTDLLAWAIERATGQSFAAVASTMLWKPMGAEQTALVTVDSRGAPRCAGGICATARDVARLGQLVLENGRRDARQVVPQAVIEDLWSGGDPEAWTNGEFAAGFTALKLSHMSYRNGWYSVAGSPRTLFAMGTHGQNLFVVPDDKLVIVKLSSLGERLNHMAVALTHWAVPEIVRCLRA